MRVKRLKRKLICRRTENNKQTNCFLKISIRKLISLPLKAIHLALTGSWILFNKQNRLSTWQKLTLKLSVSSPAHFQILLENYYQKYIKRLWNIYKYTNFLSGVLLALNSLIPYLGKIIFRPYDWTTASAKKPQHDAKQIRGIQTLRGYIYCFGVILIHFKVINLY